MLNQKDIKVYVIPLPSFSTDVFEMCHLLAGFGKTEEALGPNLKILSLNFINTASKGLYKNNSDGTLFKTLTSALLEELRPLAGYHKNT